MNNERHTTIIIDRLGTIANLDTARFDSRTAVGQSEIKRQVIAAHNLKHNNKIARLMLLKNNKALASKEERDTATKELNDILKNRDRPDGIPRFLSTAKKAIDSNMHTAKALATYRQRELKKLF